MGEYYRGFSYYEGRSERQMSKAIPKLQTVNKDIVPTNVNEIVELYSIFLCFREYESLPHIPEQDKDIYRDSCKIIPQLCGRFCSTITDDTIISCFQKISITYMKEFLLLLEKYNVFVRISGARIIELIESQYVSLSRLLSKRSIVTQYDNELAEYMRNHIETAEIIVSHLWGDSSNAKSLPRSLSNGDMHKLIESYIDLEDNKVHPTLLELIENAFDTDEFCATDELRLKARRRRVRYWENKAGDVHLFKYGYEISFSPELSAYDPVRMESGDNILKFTYSQQWLNENLDFPTILNNFIWLFGFVDYHYRCSFSPFASKLSLVESLFGQKGQRYYPTSIQCRLEQGVACGNLSAYYKQLLQSGIRLETVFEWFFNEYIPEEFGVQNYHFEAPSEQTSLLEKCKLSALLIDEILKQFVLWSKHGVIERALLEISSKTPSFDTIKSKQPRKYAYAQSVAIKQEMNLLFSDTFPIAMCNDGRTFAKLLNNQAVHKTDFEEHEIGDLEFLISRGSVTYDGNTLLPNSQRIILLRDLHENGVLCPSYLQSYEDLLSRLEEAGDIVYENTLFSRYEQQLLNQKLNRAAFVNGDDLRNKYVHGSYPLDKESQEHDYYELLVVITLIIIKINEEFLLADRQNPPAVESK